MENLPQTQEKTSPKDVFLHLLAIITLYFSAGSFIKLIFDYINLAFPDQLELSDSWRVRGIYQGIRLAIASLVVVFPTYLLTTRFLNKTYISNPSKRNLRIRKWLVYFTLFATALIIIGDLVALVYKFLGGEITPRFTLKVLTLFFVTGSIFFYYFTDLRKYRTE